MMHFIFIPELNAIPGKLDDLLSGSVMSLSWEWLDVCEWVKRTVRCSLALLEDHGWREEQRSV